MAIAESAEVIGYFFGFWLFIFSRRFRETWIAEWQKGGVPERLWQAFEATVSVIFGVAIPVMLAAWLLGHSFT